ncbi:biotin carboxylase [Nocardia amamiensis]|uniref:Biotin carboxylase n=1 Tax=Nocardia amamiensis TaxID=404578 RepID=A0ABS0D208_9NOCA|nr:biotin carboxylase [Nocardia amamiensis]MBF6302872.1 biotin carboxylase [Nocardia amamiensis]
MRPHILVIHRSRGPIAPYLERIDHTANVVTYVCAAQVRHRIPQHAAAEVVVFDGTEPVDDAVRALASRHGVPERIVAISETDLLTAAQLRSEFGIAGDPPAQALPFRDKLVMYERAAAAGVAVPAFADAPDSAAIVEFAQRYGFPVLVKPRLGAASRDILTLSSAADLADLPDLHAEPFLVQRFCPEETGTVDGVWTGTELGPWRCARYLHSCLDFATGENSLATIEIDDPALNEQLASFARAVLIALSAGVPTVFHCEFFLAPIDAPRLQLLEIAGRIPGGETTHLWREVHGYDLVGAALDIQMGRNPAARPLREGQVAGELLVRPALPPPCVVTATRLEVAPSHAPYHCAIPAVGQAITEATGYVDIGASFRFRADTSQAVAEAIRHTLSGFRMDCATDESAAAVAQPQRS